MNRLGTSRPKGLTAQGLRLWGFLFLLAGMVGKGILLNRVLQVQQYTGQELVELLKSHTQGLLMLALVLQALEACAAPIFAFLLVEGFRYTTNHGRYILRVFGLAVV